MKHSFLFLLLLLPTFAYASFSDTSGHPYETEINYLESKGIVTGSEDGKFYPDEYLSRAELVKMVIGATVSTNPTGGNCFSDVTTEWHAPYICTAKSLDIVGGYTDGNFYPYRKVTFSESLKIILKAYGIVLNEDPETPWYDQYADYSFANGLELHENILPGWMITRGQTARVMYWAGSEEINQSDSASNQPTSGSATEAKTTSEKITNSTVPSTTTNNCSSNTYNCGDFTTHAEAQNVFEYCKAQGKGDIHDLDRDNDNLACEDLP